MLFLEARDIDAIHHTLVDRTQQVARPLYDDPIEPGILNDGPIQSAAERARWGPFEEGG